MEDLLIDFTSCFPNAPLDSINHLPHGNESIDYRYGTKTIDNINDAEEIYLEALRLINITLSSIDGKKIRNNTRVLIENPFYKG